MCSEVTESGERLALGSSASMGASSECERVCPEGTRQSLKGLFVCSSVAQQIRKIVNAQLGHQVGFV